MRGPGRLGWGSGPGREGGVAEELPAACGGCSPFGLLVGRARPSPRSAAAAPGARRRRGPRLSTASPRSACAGGGREGGASRVRAVPRPPRGGAPAAGSLATRPRARLVGPAGAPGTRSPRRGPEGRSGFSPGSGLGRRGGGTESPAATFRSASTSAWVSGRNSPGRRPRRTTGPMATRLRLITLWPSLASIRRTSRFFPSASTSSRMVAFPCVPTSRARFARAFPSANQTPSVSF